MCFLISVHDDNKGFSSLGASSNNNQLESATTKSGTGSIEANKQQRTQNTNKVRKPIDLGAAAAFAAQSAKTQKQQTSCNSTVSNNRTNFVDDLFSVGGSNNDSGGGVTTEQPSSLVITGEDDDFDLGPRAPTK